MEAVRAQVDELDVPQLGENLPDVSPELVPAQIERSQLLEVPEPADREPAGEFVGGEVEVVEVPEIRDPTRDGSVEPVVRKIQALERGDGSEGRDEPAREVVSGESEVAEGG